MSQKVAHHGKGYAGFQELDGSGVAQDVGVRKLPWNFGFFSPAIEFAAEVPRVEGENPAAHHGEFVEVPQQFPNQLGGHGNGPEDLSVRFFVEDGNVDMGVSEVDIGQVVDAQDFTNARPRVAQEQKSQPVSAPDPSDVRGWSGVAPEPECFRESIDLGTIQGSEATFRNGLSLNLNDDASSHENPPAGRSTGIQKYI